MPHKPCRLLQGPSFPPGRTGLTTITTTLCTSPRAHCDRLQSYSLTHVHATTVTPSHSWKFYLYILVNFMNLL